LGGADQTYDVLGSLQALLDGIENLVDGVERNERGVNASTRDGVVLAEAALQVAVGEEDVADAFGARNGRFLAGMGVDGSHLGVVGIAVAEAWQRRAMAGAFWANHTLIKRFFFKKILLFQIKSVLL